MKPQHTTTRSPALVASALLMALMVAVLGWDLPSAAAPGRQAPAKPIVKTRRIAPGLTYTKIVRRSIPLRTHVLRIDLTKTLMHIIVMLPFRIISMSM